MRNTRIIDWMDKLSGRQVSFRILPENSDFIIGSSSKDTQGDYYKREETVAILQRQNMRNKRLFDMGMSLLLLVLSPFLIWRVRNKKGYLLNCLLVLTGVKSWVGVEHMQPALKPGVLHPADKFAQWSLDQPTVQRIREQYLHTYTTLTDLDILYKAFPLIGREKNTAA